MNVISYVIRKRYDFKKIVLLRRVIEMKEIQEQHSHENNSHDHDHDHGKMPIILYFIGLALAIVALFLSDEYQFIKKTSCSHSLQSALGIMSLFLKALEKQLRTQKNQKKFMPNSHILMGLAAIGASLVGNFWEGTLLILIFSGAHFFGRLCRRKKQTRNNEITRNESNDCPVNPT